MEGGPGGVAGESHVPATAETSSRIECSAPLALPRISAVAPELGEELRRPVGPRDTEVQLTLMEPEGNSQGSGLWANLDWSGGLLLTELG
ncbi:hypothetical protein NDU88_008557 [Pleurodeles waltl]|uniref:Uncharacterized protein n=1 Tax=Pleurodeles waltl TaxID=8319 RepID=A0AAV7PPT9_PLEWA|nr:hypothetical protein NDU88_008557 [Pleurodeles waltl]